MASRIYIAIIVLVLIGGTLSFGYWSIDQFNLALNTFDTSLNQLSASLAANTRPIPNNTTATTTDVVEIATTTPDVTITFPAKGKDVYIGCTYQLSLQSSTTIRSLETTIVDAGTGEVAGPIASGLARINKLEQNSQSLDWKVGEVWHGEYFILLSKINGVEIETKSKYFMIHKMSENVSASKREKICKESNGSF